MRVRRSELSLFLLPPFRVVSGNRHTTLLSSAGHLLRNTSPATKVALRTAGRRLSQIFTPLTLLEGAHSYYVMGRCAL